MRGKIRFCLAAACAAALLAGCAGEPAPLPGSGRAQEVPALAASPKEECRRLYGWVEEKGTETLTVESGADGSLCTFAAPEQALYSPQTVRVGAPVTVFYLAGGDGHSEQNEVLLVLPAACADGPYTVCGTVKDAAMHTLLLQTQSGAQYELDKAWAKSSLSNGLLLGDAVEVTYCTMDGVDIALLLRDAAQSGA